MPALRRPASFAFLAPLRDTSDAPMDAHPHQPGRVTLVGAGPGDPGLITVAGMQRLRAADAVVFDALANPLLLEEARPDATRHDVGKRAGHHKLTQDETNALLADLATQGEHVVRLKGGDPYLFGRGAEECAYLAARGIRCEVIPGITSGLAAPATAGIPVTHRHVASTVTLVTGHEDPTKTDTSVDYDGLAKLIARGGTVCFYMGVGRMTSISHQLTACGLAGSTPAAVVQWGTLPTQRTARGTLDTLAVEVERAGVSSPAIIVVGEVTAIDEPGLDFFTDRPLFGQTVLVTRTRTQASDLSVRLRERGANVIEVPTIELAPPEDLKAVERAVASLPAMDWLILTSANAVGVLAAEMQRQRMDARQFPRLKLAVVGDATAAALQEQLALRADLVPDRANGDALADALLARLNAPSKLLLLRADLARPTLPERLHDAGHTVTEVAAYRTQRVESLPDNVAAALRDRAVDWVTFTSSSTARNLVELLGDEAALLEHVGRASIGPITSATLAELGYPATVAAASADVAAVVGALVGGEAR